MKYEFFSTSRHISEIFCSLPVINEISNRLGKRSMRLSLSHITPRVAKTIRSTPGVSLRRKNPEFMRMSRMRGVHEPRVEEDGVIFLNMWPRQGRGMFGDFSLNATFDMCNYHLAQLGLDPISDAESMLPEVHKGHLNRRHLFSIDSYYLSTLFTPKAVLELSKEFQWSHLFSSCSRGIFAVPDTLNTTAFVAKKYKIDDMDDAMLGEFSARFGMVVAHGSETVLLDHSSSQLVLIVGDSPPYWNSKRYSYCNELIGSNGHQFMIRKLKSTRIQDG